VVSWLVSLVVSSWLGAYLLVGYLWGTCGVGSFALRWHYVPVG
jgi:hypothetical protein